MTEEGTTRTTRAQRLAMPMAREVVQDLAIQHGACIRPVQLRRTNLDTKEVEQVLVPCGHTLASVCPSCAERARALRAAQCREGWHLEHEPVTDPDPATEEQRWWIQTRADAQALRDQSASDGQDTGDLDELVTELDDEITAAGMRGNVLPARPGPRGGTAPPSGARTSRTCRAARWRPGRWARPTPPRTARRSGRRCSSPSPAPSYGRVRDDGTPADPGSYDYARAARDALHFAALFDRFIQNLRRFLGYDVQYFAAVEPQRRLAPHIHIAVRGTVSRADLRRVLAATYHQVWWPGTTTVRFDGDQRPLWDEQTCTYVDPYTGEVLPTWDDALDAIGDAGEPVHVARFGDRFDAQGVLSGSTDAARCIGYLTKYLTKQAADCHQAQTDPERAHAERLAEALRYEPCSPRCANWLRYGIQPQNARPGLVPGACKGKAHRREYLGYAGRRVLASRKWSGKTLADHRADRKNWLLATLGVSATDPARYAWEPVTPGDPDHIEHARRLLHVVADRVRWQAALTEARHRAAMQASSEISATGSAA